MTTTYTIQVNLIASLKNPSLIGLIVIFTACNLKISQEQDQSVPAIREPVHRANRSDTMAALSKLYERAIRDFLQASQHEYHLRFDTLYIGKHVYGQPDDFPDVDLPAMIETTVIRMIEPEAGLRRQWESKNVYYVNIFSWIQDRDAAFLMVTFANGMAHLFDLKIRYVFDRSRRNIETDSLHFEPYSRLLK